MLSLAAADITAFHIVGILFACWAVIVTVIGISRPDFPGGAERLVMGISAVLAVGTIGTAIGTVKGEKKEPAKAAESKTKANPAPSPSQGAAAPTPSQQGASQLKLSADPTGNLKFSNTALSAKHGPITITLTNPSPVSHNITVQTPQGAKGGPTVGKGGTSSVNLNLPAGKYVYYCSVPGHRQAGMQGELTVK